MIWQLIFLVDMSCFTGSRAFDFETVVASCFNARSNDNNKNYCDLVSWSSARIYSAGNFSIYNPGSPLSVGEQHEYARYISNKIESGITEKKSSSACTSAIKRLAWLVSQCFESF
jgi:hypothetical protein